MKGKIIFFSTPAYGHILSTLPIIKRLVELGYSVDCYTSPAFRELIDSCGANYVEYCIDFEQIVLSNATSDFFELSKMLVAVNREAYYAYEPIVEKRPPQMIIYDSMCSFAKNIAGKLGIKSVCFVATFGFNLPVFLFSNMFVSSIPLYLKNRKSFRRLFRDEMQFRKKNKLPDFHVIDLFMNCGGRTIVFSPREFKPFAWTFPKNVIFAGTTIKEREKMMRSGESYQEYEYYISMGSIFTDRIHMMEELLNDPYIQKGKSLLVSKKEDVFIGKNVAVRKWVNQLELLPHCQYFINQGGLGSAYESIYYGIPQICIPQQQEEGYVARRVKSKKLGLYMKEYDSEYIKAIRDFYGKSRIKEFQKILREKDGTAVAVKVIEKYFEQGG